MKRSFPYIRITKKQEKTVQAGHPWIYEDEITGQTEQIENGSIVDVFGSKGQYLGSGLYSAVSKIKVRILSRNANETFTDAFFERRVKYAISYRHDVMEADWNACRLIHGEADGLPGLTVDRYENILVSEVLSYGMDRRKDVIYNALKNELASYGVRIDGIYERNEGALRKREGLEQYKGWYGQPAEPVIEITENGVRYFVDVENGQKTGFFLDQKYNRRAIWTLAQGRSVLDCCTHIGTFALNAAQAGASFVRAVDISDTAIASAKENAERNGLADVMDFVQADVFDFLKNALDEHEHYDMIILDPPAFTKSRKTYDNAYQGYLRMNTMAMRILPRGGYLATASCSHFMPAASFRKMLSEAALQAGVSLRLIEERHAGFDHPVMMGIPETEYLKFFILQII